MAKKERKTVDMNQLAKLIVDKATGESKDKKEDTSSPQVKSVKKS